MILQILLIIFVMCISLLLWSIIGYPLFIWVLSKIIKEKYEYDDNYQPEVSIIIPCYNEEKVIKKKIENTLQLDYPKTKYEIIIVDDGSEDKTYETVRKIKEKNKLKNLKIIRQEREGKSKAIKSGIKNSRYDIIVITDANAFLEKNILKASLRHFKDKKIGGVGSRYSYITNEKTPESFGSKIHQDYLQFIYKNESKIGCFTNSYGWFQAFRKKLIARKEGYFSLSDWEFGLLIIKKGYKNFYETSIKAEKYSVKNKEDFILQKKRTLVETIKIIRKNIRLMNILKYPLVFLSIFSIKIIPLLSPFLVLGIIFSGIGIIILLNKIFLLIILFEFLLLSLIFILYLETKKKKNKIISIIEFLTLIEVIILISWKEYFKGKEYIKWKTAESARAIK